MILELTISDDTVKNIEELRVKIGARNNAQVIQAALAALDMHVADDPDFLQGVRNAIKQQNETR